MGWFITGTTFKSWLSYLEGEYTRKIAIEQFAPIFLSECRNKLASLLNKGNFLMRKANTREQKLFIRTVVEAEKSFLMQEIRYLEPLVEPPKEKEPPKGWRKDENFKELVERAKQHSILDVARSFGYNPKKAGKNYFIMCPFHQEEHPSCVLYPETNTYHCFGCQSHGDVIKFYMLLDNKDFVQAVRELANEY